MQGPFLFVIVCTLIIAVIGQNWEAISYVIGVIFLGIVCLVSIVLLAKGYKEFKEYRREKEQERASLRQFNPSTPQFPPTPEGAKDAAMYQKKLTEQHEQQKKNELAQWVPHEMYKIKQAIDTAIAQGRLLNDGTLQVIITEVFPEHKPGSVYVYYKAEIQKELERIYKSLRWKSVSVRTSSDSTTLYITLNT